jgi:methylated-DNA-[protein]-cysteine S-methyltransferase
MTLYQYVMESPVGPLYLVASEKGLVGLWVRKAYVKESEKISSLKSDAAAVRILARTEKQLKEYFQGERKIFDIPLDVSGTDFQKKVWNQLSKIPYGRTVSYKDISKRLNNEKATRAVGSANGKNPISIIVPCHRVIAADGGLGGYSGGLAMKVTLLELEKRHS